MVWVDLEEFEVGGSLMERLAFRIYDPEVKKFHYSGSTPTMLAGYFAMTATLVTVNGMKHEQFIGLTDVNGKDIYEGDIIDHYATYGEVIFEDGMFTLNMSAKVNFGHRQPLCYIGTTECKVIGNIHENPELMK